MREVDDTLCIGSSPMHLIDSHVPVDDVSYPKSPDLLELLFKNTPDINFL